MKGLRMVDPNLVLGNPPERIEIYYSKKKQVFIFLVSLLMAAGCAFAAYASGPGEINVKFLFMRFALPAIYFKCLMVFGACFFALCPIIIVRKAILNRPLAILDADGIKLDSLKGALIKWEDITAYNCFAVQSQEYIGFCVNEPATYTRSLSPIKRFLINLNRKTGFKDFSVPLSLISKEDKQNILHMFHFYVEG